MNTATVYAKSNNVRTSVKKVNPVLRLVRGKDVAEAQRILKFNKTKASDIVLKTLNSAIANARNNLDLSENNLYIADVYVNEGPTLMSARFASRANWTRIFKRRAHIVVGLSEKVKK